MTLARQVQKFPKLSLQAKLHRHRKALQDHIQQFLDAAPYDYQGAPTCLPNVLLDSQFASEDDDVDDDIDEDPSAGEEFNEDEDTDQDICPEDILLPLPSYLPAKHYDDPLVNPLVIQELDLRQTQALDYLHQVQLSLGLKTIMFKKGVAVAHSQSTKTRAWRSVQAVDRNLRHNARGYKLAREALLRLNASTETMKKFRTLEDSDLKISKDITEENRVGQRSEHVSWIWRVDIKNHEGEAEWIKESKLVV